MYSFDRLHYSIRGSYLVWDSRKKGILKLDMIHNHGQDIFNGILAINYGKNAKLSRWFFNYGCVRVYPLYFLPAIAFCTSVVRLFAPAMFSYALIVSVIAYVVFLVMYAFDSAK